VSNLKEKEQKRKKKEEEEGIIPIWFSYGISLRLKMA